MGRSGFAEYDRKIEETRQRGRAVLIRHTNETSDSPLSFCFSSASLRRIDGPGLLLLLCLQPPLKAAAQFMDAMEKRNEQALKSDVIVSSDIEEGKLREPTDRELKNSPFRRFQRGRILDQRRHEGKSRDLYYLVYREPDGRVFALIALGVQWTLSHRHSRNADEPAAPLSLGLHVDELNDRADPQKKPSAGPISPWAQQRLLLYWPEAFSLIQEALMFRLGVPELLDHRRHRSFFVRRKATPRNGKRHRRRHQEFQEIDQKRRRKRKARLTRCSRAFKGPRLYRFLHESPSLLTCG